MSDDKKRRSKSSEKARARFLFIAGALVAAAVAAIGVAFPGALSTSADAVTSSIFEGLDWFFMLSVSAMAMLAIGLALGKTGKIVLGKPGERPEFSLASWLSMLFAAGMGAGLLFWGVAEPVTHFGSGPVARAGLSTEAAAERAMVITNFHWGIHAWAVYGIAALVLAYFCFRRGTDFMPSAPLKSAFKAPWVASVGLMADFVATLAIAFGVAGSIGMGVFQMHKGLAAVGWVPEVSRTVDVAILVVLVVCYMTSASTSLDKGIKILSNLNMAIAIALLAFVLMTGPTAHLLRVFVDGLGDYVTAIPALSLNVYPYDGERSWFHGWTLTYFFWWIAWAPFVGIFIARISKGRTIREFVLGVLLAPTLFSIVWFAVFGGTGLHEELAGGGGILASVREDVAGALFLLLERMPLGSLLSVSALLLIFIFLVTSVDSATFVLGILTSPGKGDPTRPNKLTWGLILGVLGGALALTRNIDVVRAVAVLGAIPFSFVLILQAAALVRALRQDTSMRKQ